MASPPSTFTRRVSNGKETVTVDFKLHPIRSSNFQVLVQDETGKFATQSAPPPRTYLGTVQGHPGALASGLLKEDGRLLCRISFQSGVEWSSTGGTASVRGNNDWTPHWPTTGVVHQGGAGSVVYAAEVGVDASNRQFVAANSNIIDNIEIAEYSVLAANVFYLRDAAILHRIGKLVVRASKGSDPYVTAGNDTNLLLQEVKRQWNNVLPVGNSHHLALVAQPEAGGGLSWVGVIGTSNCYSANGADSNGDFSVIWRHEAGHNWGSSHYEGGGQPEGPTIMSDNALSRFSSSELLKVLEHRDTKISILDNLGAYSFVVPPRANMVTGRFLPGNAITLDLLENASDSNGQALMLLSFPDQSALGGTVTRSAGKTRRTAKSSASPGSILYTPPAKLTRETDYFSYEIQDNAGSTATGYVTLQPEFDDDLAAHWTFNDGKGTTALETTSSESHGQTSSNGTSWVAGHIGGAIRLDGNASHVAVEALDLNTNTLTIAGWVKRDGSQADWAALTMCRDSGTTAGFNLGTANELRYHWGAGSNPSYNFNSGLVLPNGIWTFCALVISPTKATIYMRTEGSTQGLQSAGATGTFSPQRFAGTFYFAYDPNNKTRHFKGDMDDFRVFRRALTVGEITSLANDGGTPSTPSPCVRGTRLACKPFDFSWMSAPSSKLFQVYLGTSYNAVRDGTTASPEYIGSTGTGKFRPSKSLDSEGTWFWRVDANDDSATIKGAVWYFYVVANNPGLVGWWKMDEGIGNTVSDSSGTDAHGSITGDATWGSGKEDGGLILNGKGGVACGNAASLDGNTPFSVSAWVKLPNKVGGTMVIIQQRGPDDFNGEYQLRVTPEGKPAFWIYGEGSDQFNITASKAINDNEWHRVVAVRDGTEGRIYIDGSMFGWGSGTLRNLRSSIPVFIGYDGRDNTNYLSGTIDEVQVYNRAISENEMAKVVKRVSVVSKKEKGERIICGVD